MAISRAKLRTCGKRQCIAPPIQFTMRKEAKMFAFQNQLSDIYSVSERLRSIMIVERKAIDRIRDECNRTFVAPLLYSEEFKRIIGEINRPREILRQYAEERKRFMGEFRRIYR